MRVKVEVTPSESRSIMNSVKREECLPFDSLMLISHVRETVVENVEPAGYRIHILLANFAQTLDDHRRCDTRSIHRKR